MYECTTSSIIHLVISIVVNDATPDMSGWAIPYILPYIWTGSRLAISNTMKLLGFLHLNVTNQMVPNLTHVFIFIGFGLRNSFARSLLGGNGYFIAFFYFF